MQTSIGYTKYYYPMINIYISCMQIIIHVNQVQGPYAYVRIEVERVNIGYTLLHV